MIIPTNNETGRYKIINLGTGTTATEAVIANVWDANNLGNGAGLYASKSGHTLNFKSLKAGSNITLTPSSTGITISSSGGGGTITASNGLTKVGSDIRLGGTLTGETGIDATGQGLFVYATEGTGSYVDVGNSSATWGLFQSYPTVGTRQIHLTANNIATIRLLESDLSAKFIDNRATKKGLEYNGDYSASYTDRSLVDRGYVLGSKTYTDGAKQIFNPNATTAGFNWGAHTANPSTTINADAWYNSTDNLFYGKKAGAVEHFLMTGVDSSPFLEINNNNDAYLIFDNVGSFLNPKSAILFSGDKTFSGDYSFNSSELDGASATITSGNDSNETNGIFTTNASGVASAIASANGIIEEINIDATQNRIEVKADNLNILPANGGTGVATVNLSDATEIRMSTASNSFNAIWSADDFTNPLSNTFIVFETASGARTLNIGAGGSNGANSQITLGSGGDLFIEKANPSANGYNSINLGGDVNGIQITTSSNNGKGLYFAADYSSRITNRSVPDKEYVDKEDVVAKTTNYGIQVASDGDNFFTNAGATGSVNFTLPTAAAGLTYTFYIDAAQTLTITAGASTTIRIAGNVSASAGNITSNTVGNCITLVAISSTKWVTKSHEGTWTVN